jgi:lipopolysaccharide/colanic/teichoic acid biosynthesis glycosyltransferase
MRGLDALRRLNPFARRRARDAVGVLPEEAMRRVIDCERGRADRTGREFAVVAFAFPADTEGEGAAARLAAALARRVRRTDAVGWLGADRPGVVLSDTGARGAHALGIETALGFGECGRRVSFAVQVFPAKRAGGAAEDVPGSSRGGNVARRGGIAEFLATRTPRWKRVVDVAVASAGLVVFGPVMLLAALLIKCVSSGPAFFRQTRIGLAGRPFGLLKLRSMRAGNDASVHRRHAAELIRSGEPMEKLASDGRVFALGSFLRRTCIDELPQLVNVLRGEMSLVGPRPCLAYEAAEYACWHARRFDIAPGMTGLWQVSGKNALTFAEMVRLDIAYVRTLSPWLDLKILVKTPFVVLAGILPGHARAEGTLR